MRGEPSPSSIRHRSSLVSTNHLLSPSKPQCMEALCSVFECLQASVHTIPFLESLCLTLPHLNYAVFQMYVYKIYIHDFLLYFYYTQTLLPSHTFYTSFPFLKHFSVTAVTIPVILLYSLPLGVGPVFSDSMIPFLPFRESHCVNFVVMFPVGPVFPLSQPTLSQ